MRPGIVSVGRYGTESWLFGDPKFLGEFGRRTVRHLLILINLRGFYTVPAENPVQRWQRAEARHHRIVS